MGDVRSQRAGAFVACMASVLLGVSSARAHGAVPRASAPLASDVHGITLVRLTRGLALRDADGFRYYCPPHWDNNENDPAVPLPNGAALLGFASGLYLVQADGSVSAYPEQDLGTTVALTSTSTAAYLLSLRAGSYEVRRVAPDHSELVWSAAQSAGDWLTLGASDQSLLLLGLDRTQLTQLQLDPHGSELARASAPVAQDTLSVQAQPVGTTPYLILQFESGDRIELGRIANGQWLSLVRASGNLAGPIQTSEGKLLVAVDGALAAFDAERVTPLGGSDFVTGLARFGSDSYAAVHAGLAVLSADRPSTLVFDFSRLAEPLYTGLSAAERTACVNSWQHLQVDLVAAGFTDLGAAVDAGAPIAPATGMLDAATPPPAKSGSAKDEDAGASSEPTALADASTTQTQPDGGGCTISPSGSATRGEALMATLLALCTARRSRRRRAYAG